MFELLKNFAFGYMAGCIIRDTLNGTAKGLDAAKNGAFVQRPDGTYFYVPSHEELAAAAHEAARPGKFDPHELALRSRSSYT